MPVSRDNSTLNSHASYCRPVPLNVDRTLLDQGFVRGYAATFAKGFAPGSFKASLDTWRACGTLPHMTWNGDPGDVIGKLTSVLEDSNGLLVTGKLALGTERGSLIRKELQSGIDGLSAFFGIKSETDRLITEAHLSEVSLIREAAIPASTEARATAPKLSNAVDFERWLRSQGMAKNAAKKLAAGGWPNLNAPNIEDEAELQALAKVLSNATFELSTRR